MPSSLVSSKADLVAFGTGERTILEIAQGLDCGESIRALLQFFLPENYFDVKKALKLARREDLIGDGSECLIPAQPSRLARDARDARAAANATRAEAGDRARNGDRQQPAGYRSAARKSGRN